MLTLKTVTLLTILSAQRIQTAHLLDIHNMLVSDSVVKISIGDKLKQTRPGYHLNELQFPAYNPHNELCQVLVVKEYLARMKPLHGNITSLGLAGVDLTRFKPHSVWAASASAASHENVLLGTILRTAGWSSQSTFAKYYPKEMHKEGAYATTVLNTSLSVM